MKNSKQEFTLIELLVVIGIIAVIASIALGVTQIATRKANEAKTKSQMQQLETALDQYRDEFGYYPQTGGDAVQIWDTFIKGKGGSGTWYHGLQLPTADSDKDYLLDLSNLRFSNGYCVDPMGNPYQYECPGSENPTAYDLWSYGPDGDADTKDDITNW